MKSPKLSFVAIATFLVTLTMGMMTLNSDAKAFLFSKGPAVPFSELSSQLQTPKDIAKFMWRHFMYVQDKRQFGQDEYWQSPREFFGNKKGDCEDFALFAKSLLEANGIRAALLNVYGNGFAHTVCVYETEDGKYNVIDGAKIKKYEADSLEELSTKIHRHWKKAAIVAPSKTAHRGKIIQSFEKRMKSHTTLATFA